MKVFRTESAGDAEYNELVSLLKAAGVIAFPTDTAYGLGADPFNEAAVNRIFQIKGRPETKPVLLLVNSMALAQQVTRPNDLFHKVAERFWPGPLTIIVHAQAHLPGNVTAGTGTVGVRWPNAPFAMELVQRLKTPITATSANRAGMPAAVTAEEVRTQLGDSVDALIDGGVLPARGGSTLLDLTVDPPAVLREGPVSFESLAEFFGGRLRRGAS